MGSPRTLAQDNPHSERKAEEILPNAVYTSEEAARLLRISMKTLRLEVRAGRLKKQGYGKNWKFEGCLLRDWLRNSIQV